MSKQLHGGGAGLGLVSLKELSHEHSVDRADFR